MVPDLLLIFRIGKDLMDILINGFLQRRSIAIQFLTELLLSKGLKTGFGAIGQYRIHLQDVFTNTAIGQGMKATGIVPQHPPYHTAVGRGGLGAELQAVLCQKKV